jgi:predicted unusual protein kinase regulating ubiquinone biosynthesis (AarF/ABC1/UbiB family)
VDARVAEDQDALDELARFLDAHMGRGHAGFAEAFAELRIAMLDELDYVREAQNLRTLRTHLAEFESITIPQPIDGYTTARVLTMDYVVGTKVTKLSPLVRMEAEGEELGYDLVRAYLHQIIVDGFFHADPHPGNVYLTDDGRLALLDLGMVGQLTPLTRDRLLELLLGAAEGRPEETADVIMELGRRRESFDEPALRRSVAELVARYQRARLADIQLGRVLLELNREAAMSGLDAPRELALLGKTLLNLDHVVRTLAPRLDVNRTIHEQSVTLIRRRLLKSVTPATVLTTTLEAKRFAERLPARVNRVLDAVASGDMRMKVEVIDQGAIMTGLEKVANRVALGLVVAALFIAAAVMMQVPTPFRLFGYPGLAMILLAAGTAGVAMLAAQIVVRDRSRRPRV